MNNDKPLLDHFRRSFRSAPNVARNDATDPHQYFGDENRLRRASFPFNDMRALVPIKTRGLSGGHAPSVLASALPTSRLQARSASVPGVGLAR